MEASGATIAGPRPPACSGRDARVIIIGCGLAGLNCAKHLLERGLRPHQIVMLEASNRIGGRIKTDNGFIEGLSVRAREGPDPLPLE